MTDETKKELKKAIRFGHSDDFICDMEGITEQELAEIKRQAGV